MIWDYVLFPIRMRDFYPHLDFAALTGVCYLKLFLKRTKVREISKYAGKADFMRATGL